MRFIKFKRKIKRERVVIAFLLGFILSLYIALIQVSSEINNRSGEIWLINLQIQDLKKQNELLRTDLLQREALTTIYSQAIQQGFVPDTFFWK